MRDEGLEAFGEVVCIDEVGEVLLQLAVNVKTDATNCGRFDDPVRPAHLLVGPGMPWLGEAVFYIGEGARNFEGMGLNCSLRASMALIVSGA